jgi:hypothetical protein
MPGLARRLARPMLEGGQETSMTDLLIVALTLALFAATVGFVRLCERM